MPLYPVHAVTLDCHPVTPVAAVRGVSARVRRNPGGALALAYVIEGEIDCLRVPPAREPRFAERLWEHTCCEIFIARKGLPEYHEFNFSPSGEWAVYAFERYREKAPTARRTNVRERNPQVRVRRSPAKLELDVVISLDFLPPADRDATLAAALSAVVEHRDGSLSYWAMKHPPGRPDFHHAAGYALELA